MPDRLHKAAHSQKFGAEVAAETSSFSRKKENPLERGLKTNRRRFLAVAGHGPHLPWQEMVGRPGAGHDHLAILELLGGRAVAVLIFFDRLGIDEMSDIEQHSVGVNLLTAD